MIYDVDISEQAEMDLRNIYVYIAAELQARENADGQLERIEDAIYKLDQFPERFQLYDEEPWKSKGVRVLVVDNYIALYVIDYDNTLVTVIRVMYGGRDVNAQLKLDFENE